MIMIIALFIIIVGITSSMLISSQRQKSKIREKFLNKNNNKLSEENIFAKKYYRLSIVMLFIIPIPFAFILAIVKDEFIKDLLIIILLISIMGTVMFALYYWNVEGITKSIIKEREMSNNNK